jgi:hypothetical protein
METWLVHERLFDDEAFCKLSHVGQLTFLKLFRLCDRNWGHVGFSDWRCLAADLWVHEKARILHGDDEVIETIAEAERQLHLACEVGLLIHEETRDGNVVGFRSWECYTGAKRLQRALPEFAMGQRLADTRDWTKAHHRGREALGKWAERLSLALPLFAKGSCKVDEGSYKVDEGSERLAKAHNTSRSQEPGTRSQVPGAFSEPSESEPSVETSQPELLTSKCDMPDECREIVERVSRLALSELALNACRSLPARMPEFREKLACDSLAHYLLALALTAKSENDAPDWQFKTFGKMLRERNRPPAEFASKAAAMLNGEAKKPKPPAEVVHVDMDDWLAGGDFVDGKYVRTGGGAP